MLSILFLLIADGVVISLDLTKHAENMKKTWLVLFITELNYTASIIIIANLITITFYFHLRNRRRQSQARTTEINHVVQDILRLNNLQTATNNNVANGVNSLMSNINQENRADANLINSQIEPNVVEEINFNTVSVADNNPELIDNEEINLNSYAMEHIEVNEISTNYINDNLNIDNTDSGRDIQEVNSEVIDGL